MATCSVCHGTGRVPNYAQAKDERGNYIPAPEMTCSICSGSGQVADVRPHPSPRGRSRSSPGKPGGSPAQRSDAADVVSKRADINGRWALIGAIACGGWAAYSFDGEGRWWIAGLAAVVGAYLVGSFYQILIFLALLAAAFWAYVEFLAD